MRRVLAGLLCVLAVVTSGCNSAASPQVWRSGQLVVGTGNTTGVFYQVGGGYADVISQHLPGYQAITAPTAGSADNLLRLSRGDLDIALTFADVAGDAMRREGAFTAGQPPIRALARLYRNYAHVVVRTDAGIRTMADLRGKRVSTAARNSGAESVALRLLVAAGLDPDRDIHRRSLSLPEATRELLAGSIDALFWSAGLPTVGITELMSKGGHKVAFLPVGDLLPALEQRYPQTYVSATIPTGTYGLPADVPTIAVVNLLVVPASIPDDLAYQLTRLIFDYQHELEAVHPEWRNVDRQSAALTNPVPLHPGAARFYLNS